MVSEHTTGGGFWANTVYWERKVKSKNIFSKHAISVFSSYQHTKVPSDPRNLFLLVHNRSLPGSHWLTLHCWQNIHMLICTQNALLHLAGKLLLVVTAVVSSALTLFLNVYVTLFCPICVTLFFSSSFSSPLLSGSSLRFCVRYYFLLVFAFDQTQQEWMYSSAVCWKAKALINHRASITGFINS